MILFILSMPVVVSWDGKWSGDDKRYYMTRVLDYPYEENLIGKKFRHKFADGSVAEVSCISVHVDIGEYLMTLSDGFYAYEWMITNIIQNGTTDSN